MRTSVYVDGFNLYYGALKRTTHRWLDIAALCRRVLDPVHVVTRVRYFTALVKSQPGNPSQHVRQQSYIQALQAFTPEITVHRGSFQTHEKTRLLADGSGNKVRVLETTEKRTDVNLASYLLLDAFKGEFEAAIIISNDSDLATPIGFVRDLGLDVVGILNPYGRMTTNPAVDLKKVSKFQTPIMTADVEACQLPDVVRDAKGREIRKPDRWR